MAEEKTGTRSDHLRRRPESIRYFYMAVSSINIHTGASFGGMKYVLDKHGIESIYLADLITGQVREVTEPVADFMEKWKANYADTGWDYFGEIDRLAKAAARRK